METGTEIAVDQTEPQTSEDELALIKMWQSKIIRAKAKWEPDFKRMRRNMRFVSGLQWPGQAEMDIDKYVNNICLRMVNQKVASLYAKNPTFVAEAVERMNYTLWDGEMESLLAAIAQAGPIVQGGQPLPPEMAMFFADIESGRMKEQMVKKVGETLTKVFNYAVRSQKPEFKQQLKQCVRRAVICGVAYGRPVFCRDGEGYYKPSTIDFRSGATERANRAQAILSKAGDGEIETDSATVGTLKSLALSLQTSDSFELPERLDFDFPPSTSVLVDPQCRSLVDFVNARWLCIEYNLPVEEVNSIFNVEIQVAQGSGTAIEVTPAGQEVPKIEEDTKTDFFEKKMVHLWEVFDYNSKTRFFICDGWKHYVMPPEVPQPMVSGFWPLFSLTFNELETDNVCVDEDKAPSIFPPSDVQTMKSPQMEWNRSREDWRDQRRANSPVWMYRKGTIQEPTLTNLANGMPNECVGVETPADQPLDQFFVRRPVAAIDPAMYETASLEQDIMLGTGMQQADLGPAQPNVTATVGSIAEQSRLNVSASNIDDLDGFLSRLAQAGGEMLLQEMSVEVVKHIAGDGAVWPTQPEIRAQFLNEVFLKIEAASSGRPNKAIDIANWRDLAPIMQAAGANPIGMVKETAKRLDDNMSVFEFFPLLPPAGSLSPSGEDGSGNSTNKADSSGETASNGAPGSSSAPGPAMSGGNDGGASSGQVPAIQS